MQRHELSNYSRTDRYIGSFNIKQDRLGVANEYVSRVRSRHWIQRRWNAINSGDAECG
jgi:hypothetical protein